MSSFELKPSLSKPRHTAICNRGPFKLKKQALRGALVLDELNDLDLSFKNGFSVIKISGSHEMVEWGFHDEKKGHNFVATAETITKTKLRRTQKKAAGGTRRF